MQLIFILFGVKQLTVRNNIQFQCARSLQTNLSFLKLTEIGMRVISLADKKMDTSVKLKMDTRA